MDRLSAILQANRDPAYHFHDDVGARGMIGDLLRRRSAWVAAALTAALGMGLGVLIATPEEPAHGIIFALAAAALAAIALACAGHPDASREAPRHGRRDAVILGIAAGVWLLGLAWVQWLRLHAGPPGNVTWSLYPFADSRWLVALYWLTLGCFLFLPLALRWLFDQGWRSSGLPPGDLESDLEDRRLPPLSKRRCGAAVFLAILAATALFGPPWNLERSKSKIDWHETLHWGGLQAIDRGSMPYVEAASTNYGPGMQLLTYHYMSRVSSFTVPGFREFYTFALWLTAACCLAIAAVFLPWQAAALAAFFLLVASPLTKWHWMDGILHGFFGWANVLRTAGSLFLAVGAYAVTLGAKHPEAAPASPRRQVLRAGALGVAWGLLAYLAQENYFSGVAVVGGVFGLAVLGRRASLRWAVRSALGVGAGFAVVWVPILAVYAAEGQLGAFVHHYFLVPRRFLRGYANMSYGPILAHDRWGLGFYFTPYLVGILGILTLYGPRPWRPKLPLSQARLLTAAVALAFLVGYPSSLLRSDPLHFLSTLLPLPFVLALGITVLPGILSPVPAKRWIVGATVAAISVATFLPALRNVDKLVAANLRGRWASFHDGVASHPPAVAPSHLAARFGPTLPAFPQLGLYELLKREVADDPVLVVVEALTPRPGRPNIFEGMLYFGADLRPGPIWMERSDMVATSVDVEAFLEHLERRVTEFRWLVSSLPAGPEVDVFRRSNPAMTTKVIEHQGLTLYLFDRRPQSTTGTGS